MVAKHSRILLYPILLASSPFTQASDFSVGASYGQQQQVVEIDTQNQTLTSHLLNYQFNYSQDDWVAGVIIGGSDDSDQWQVTSKREASADSELDSIELFARVYIENWSASLAVGQSETHYQQSQVNHKPNNSNNFVDKVTQQQYAVEDTFAEISVAYWFDLSNLTEDLALSLEGYGGYFVSSGQQSTLTRQDQVDMSQRANSYISNHNIALGVQNATEFKIDDSQWQFGYVAELSYPIDWFKQEGYLSVWQGADASLESEGVLTTSRSVDGQRPRVREFPLDQTGQQQAAETILSYGADIDWYLTEKLSLGLSASKSEVTDWSWQTSVFYSF